MAEDKQTWKFYGQLFPALSHRLQALTFSLKGANFGFLFPYRTVDFVVFFLRVHNRLGYFYLLRSVHLNKAGHVLEWEHIEYLCGLWEPGVCEAHLYLFLCFICHGDESLLEGNAKTDNFAYRGLRDSVILCFQDEKSCIRPDSYCKT